MHTIYCVTISLSSSTFAPAPVPWLPFAAYLLTLVIDRTLHHPRDYRYHVPSSTRPRQPPFRMPSSSFFFKRFPLFFFFFFFTNCFFSFLVLVFRIHYVFIFFGAARDTHVVCLCMPCAFQSGRCGCCTPHPPIRARQPPVVCRIGYRRRGRRRRRGPGGSSHPPVSGNSRRHHL